MSVGLSAILAVAFLTLGIISFQNRGKTRKPIWTLAYIVLFVLCVACILYIIAALFLLGGIE